MPDAEPKKHCWHNDETGFTLGDGSRSIMCCHCGETGFMRPANKLEKPEGHGPFAPLRNVVTWKYPDGPCPGAKA